MRKGPSVGIPSTELLGTLQIFGSLVLTMMTKTIRILKITSAIRNVKPLYTFDQLFHVTTPIIPFEIVPRADIAIP
jgi:hypothetical protein